jgi:hypothetical protein
VSRPEANPCAAPDSRVFETMAFSALLGTPVS